MSDVMKIGGKTPSNTVKGVNVDANGNLITSRLWDESILTLYSDSVADTSEKRTVNTDLSSYPLVSLRITNRTGVSVKVTPLVDLYNTDNGYSLTDIDGSELSFEVAPNNAFAIITPVEAPWLNYVKYLRFKFRALETPSADTPTLSIYAVVRK